MGNFSVRSLTAGNDVYFNIQFITHNVLLGQTVCDVSQAECFEYLVTCFSAIADTLFLLTLPFSISHRLHKGWKFGNGMCKFEEGVKFLNYYGSVFFITAMAVDRYRLSGIYRLVM